MIKQNTSYIIKDHKQLLSKMCENVISCINETHNMSIPFEKVLPGLHLLLYKQYQFKDAVYS